MDDIEKLRYNAFSGLTTVINMEISNFVLTEYPSFYQMIQHSTEEMKDFFSDIMEDIYRGLVDAIDAGAMASVKNSWNVKDIERFAALTIDIYADKAKEKIRTEVAKWEEE